MKLHKLHITDLPFRPIHHSNSIPGSYTRICGAPIHLTSTSCSQNRYSGKKGSHLRLILFFHDVSAITSDIRCRPCHYFSEMMLRYQVKSKSIFKNSDIGKMLHLMQNRSLYFPSRFVFIVQYPVDRMTTFSSQRSEERRVGKECKRLMLEEQ